VTEKLEHVGVTIRRARRRADLTQGELADLVGMSRVSISNIERGHSEPKTDTTEKLFEVLDIGISDTALARSIAKKERQRCVDVCFKQAEANIKTAEQSRSEIMAMTYTALASECSLLGFIIASLPEDV